MNMSRRGYRKSLIHKRLIKLTTQILCHPILPGGAYTGLLISMFTSGSVIGHLLASIVATGIYLVGDELDERVNDWIDSTAEKAEAT